MFSLSSLQPSGSTKSPPHHVASLSHSHSHSHSRSQTHNLISLSPHHQTRRRRRHPIRPLVITNIDAAQPYDYESKLLHRHNNNNNNDDDDHHSLAVRHASTATATAPNSFRQLKIGIVGFGNYGQFLARTLLQQGHTVLAHSRSDYSHIASKLGVSFFLDPHDLCEEHPEVILLSTSILSTKSMLQSLPLQRLKRNTLFVDVLSVKEFPRSLFLEMLPRDFDILCTHPMFGPESGKNGWNDLPFVYDKVRVGKSDVRVKRCDSFIDVFRREGCRMVEMTCAEHDKYAAGSQFITHLMGRVLQNLNLESTPINTKGYESLLNLVDNTSKDSFELFYGLFLFNKNAMEEVQRLDLAFELVKKQLFGRLHELLRDQLFESPQPHPHPHPIYNGVDKKELPKLIQQHSSHKITAPDSSDKNGSLLVSAFPDGEKLDKK